MRGRQMHNVGDPTAPQDVATKAYVDSKMLDGITVKDGNVGINSNSPTDKLTVVSSNGSENVAKFISSGNIGIDIVGSDSLHQFFRFYGGSNARWEFGNNPDNKFYFNKDAGSGISGSSMVLAPDGNVGIGTSNPQAKLDVNGDMSKVTTGTYLIYIKPPSGKTTSIVKINNFSTSTMAIARASYVQIYAWAGSGIGMGEIIASTRRSNNNSNWADIDNKHIQSHQSGTTIPNLFWDNGTLKISTGTHNAGTYTIQITIRSGDIEKL